MKYEVLKMLPKRKKKRWKTYKLGHEFGCSSFNLPSTSWGRASFYAGWCIQAIHVNEVIDTKILIKPVTTGIWWITFTEIAPSFDGIVNFIRNHSMVPCIFYHPSLVSLIMQHSIANLFCALQFKNYFRNIEFLNIVGRLTYICSS